MLGVLSQTVAEICAAEDLRQLEAALTRGTQALGFVSFNLCCGKASGREFMTDPTLTTWTLEERVAYDRDGWFERDPLLAHAVGTGPTLAWRRTDWQAGPHHDYYEYITSVGLQGGITVPMNRGSGRLGALTMLSLEDRPSQDRVHAAEIVANTARARLAAIGVENAVGRSASAGFRALSPCQKEILKWAAMGKSNADIGLIMGMTRRGIDYHMSAILRKLGVNSRVQAIVIFAQHHA
ncbi:helix-turn-helix transcriptional regulator [Paracoccus siganidrum]|uniref:LuxR family transcriptional regulator n=1 Tax=Paracoccus siganidrum TaxID=1276757 RepID=A0A419A7Q0_9RHOB|nr:LuxR family transcriptional regulator [Paracoccus siganidrum]RJL16606.1 LuxR family transcriptional regulator [Paracoccus siganidrum]RMC34560.1 LuxR family transcriptional regulator [Paracoccus siganidrum]